VQPVARTAVSSAVPDTRVVGMNFWVTYPLTTHPYNPEFVTKTALTRFCTVAEAAGFAGVGFTDHPAPTERWLKAGGHDALDPFAALSFCAAVTDRMRLIPNIVVLPYRNPFLVAKAAATLDALSGGRFTLAVATGYLRGEYRALGVDFSERNSIFDESIEVIRGVWSQSDFSHQGSTFAAKGQTANPKPDPHPPIWIGGNSALSRRRVARYGDGWSPFPAPRGLAHTAKTPPLETVADLRPMLDELWHYVEAAGRDRGEIDVSFGSSAGGDPGSDRFNADAQLAAVDELAQLGITWSGVGVPGDSLDHAVESLERFGKSVIG
jgi:probable F420-dependent oxidoreductase